MTKIKGLRDNVKRRREKKKIMNHPRTRVIWVFQPTSWSVGGRGARGGGGGGRGEKCLSSPMTSNPLACMGHWAAIARFYICKVNSHAPLSPFSLCCVCARTRLCIYVHPCVQLHVCALCVPNVPRAVHTLLIRENITNNPLREHAHVPCTLA